MRRAPASRIVPVFSNQGGVVSLPVPEGRTRRLLAATALLVLVLAVWSVLAAVGARDDLLQARAGLEALREQDQVDLDAAAARLVLSTSQARHATRRLDQPGPWLVARVPLIGRTLLAERATARAVESVLEAGTRLLPRLQAVEVQGGGADIEALRVLEAELASAAESLSSPLAALDEVPLTFTPPQVRTAVNEARSRLSGLDEKLRRAAAGVDALAGLAGADRPRTLVVAIMNNAELRGAGGYASSIAVITTEGGRITVGPFRDVNTFEDPAASAVRVPAPVDYERRYGVFLANSTLWKNVLMSPDGPASAGVLCEVAKLEPGVSCDGVLLLDVPVLARLAELSGPVTLADGQKLAGSQLVRALLVDAYAQGRETGQSARRESLRQAADAALEDLLLTGLGALDTVRVLSEAASGRRLVLWSADGQEQEALVRAGLAGSVQATHGEDLQLAVENQLSAGKLDYYVRREVDVDVIVDRRVARVQQEVRLSLDMPDDLDEYVTGQKQRALTGVLDIAVAPGASLLGVTQDGLPVAHDVVSDTGSQRVVLLIDLADRSRRSWTVNYEVPVDDGRYRLRLLPQPLVHDAHFRLRIDAARGLELLDGPVRYDGPYASQKKVDVTAEDLPWWRQRVPRP